MKLADINEIKDEVFIKLRDLEGEARTLLFRIAKARTDLHQVKTEDDLRKFAMSHELEEGFKHIELF